MNEYCKCFLFVVKLHLLSKKCKTLISKQQGESINCTDINCGCLMQMMFGRVPTFPHSTHLTQWTSMVTILVYCTFILEEQAQQNVSINALTNLQKVAMCCYSCATGRPVLPSCSRGWVAVGDLQWCSRRGQSLTHCRRSSPHRSDSYSDSAGKVSVAMRCCHLRDSPCAMQTHCN